MESPINQAALLVRDRVEATAVSIYERWRDEDRLCLTGCIGWESGIRGPASELKRPDLAPRGPWVGLTSFVAFQKRILRVPSSKAGAVATLDGRSVTIVMDPASCEIIDPGPFLGVPILDGAGETLGVIRALRSESCGRPFTDEDERRLTWVARFLALSFMQERMRVDLIEGLMSIATCDDESDALERIAVEAKRLLNHPSAVFLQQPPRPDSPQRYVFRAPMEIEGNLQQKEYTKDSRGYTSLVLFDGWPHVLSPNLVADSSEGGPLHAVGHEPKAAEGGTAEAAAFVAVPIPGRDAGSPPIGVIRASSSTAYAFSRRDVETLRALARQATVVLRKQEEMRDRQVLFQTIVDTSSRPILAIDNRARVTACNDAMGMLLGVPKEEALGQPLLRVAYAGKKKLARANQVALNNANGSLRDHYTTVYRKCTTGLLTIPVRVDASYLRSASSGEVTGAVAYLEDLRGPHFQSELTVVGREPLALLTVDPDTAREVRRIAAELHGDTDLHVLISGETGVGKELLANAAAEALERPTCRRINCAGLAESIMESELFGAARGIATGLEPHPGVFDPKFTGTVVLDEIQELSLQVQAKLLRVLDTGKVRPVGAVEEISLTDKLRVVALTNADLSAMEAEKSFRSDLKHRLLGVTFHLKPLRERRADIMQLADYFLGLELARRPDGPHGFGSQTIRALLTYTWPGNVRELRKTIGQAFNRSVATGSSHFVISVTSLPEHIQDVRTDHDHRDPLTGRSDPHLASRLMAVDELVADLHERVKKLETVRDADIPYSQILEAALSTDSGLRARLQQGGAEALKTYFRTAGHREPGRSRSFELLKKFGLEGGRRKPVQSGLKSGPPSDLQASRTKKTT